MQKLALWGSASLVAIMMAMPVNAQTWSLSPEDAAKAATSKDEVSLLKDAIAALQAAKKTDNRPEIESALNTVNSVLQKLAQAGSGASAPTPVVTASTSNDELAKLAKDPKQWVSPTGDYFNQRHSGLKQINADNVGKMQLAWQF